MVSLFRRIAVLSVALAIDSAVAQNYIVSRFAGGSPLPTPRRATDAPIRPTNIAVDRAGNVYFSSSNCIYRIDEKGTLTRVGGIEISGFWGDGGPALRAQFAQPDGLAVAGSGEVYIADFLNNRIRRIDSDGVISSVAGVSRYVGYTGDGGLAVNAGLSNPAGLATDRSGALYFADSGNHRIRKITPDGKIQTTAGNGLSGNSGDGGRATEAAVGMNPGSIRNLAIDADGFLYMTVDNLVRRVSPDGIIASIPLPVENSAIRGNEYSVYGIATDNSGNLYVSESANIASARVRRISKDGTVTTIAGGGTSGFSGDDGPASLAHLGRAVNIAVDGRGNLLLADRDNMRIRRVSPAGTIATIAGTGVERYLGEGGPAR